jgi:hypothetical protein
MLCFFSMLLAPGKRRSVLGTLTLLTVVLASTARADGDCFQASREIRALGAGSADSLREAKQAAANDCWYTIHIHAVRVSDCCAGSRAAGIDPGQVARWIEKANDVYRAARVRFEFDPTPGKGDWDMLNASEVNDLVAARPGDRVWERGLATANEFASYFPRKLVVFFRHGPGSVPTGGGFSSDRDNFVIMPGFDATTVCEGAQNIDLLAHELGHYLGLKHTFREFKTKAEATAALKRSKFSPVAFDGDGLEDTAPEPYIEDVACTPVKTVTLNGVPFLLLRDNVMSYYGGPAKTLTPGQVHIVRTTLERRFAHAMDDTGPFVPDRRRSYQIASLDHGRVLEVDASTSEAEPAVRLAPWTGRANQGWKAVPLVARDAGFFEIVSTATEKCLTLAESVSGKGVVLIQADWGGVESQKWRFVLDERGELRIEAKSGGKVLTAEDGPRARDQRVVSSGDRGDPNQRWRLLPAD